MMQFDIIRELSEVCLYKYSSDITQSQFLTEWWNMVRIFPNHRYELLAFVTKNAKGRKEPYPKELLKKTRHQFAVTKYSEFPASNKCFLHPEYDREGYILIRHHIIMLSNWGANRRINIVTLCEYCHAYFHPWLFKELEQRQEAKKQLQGHRLPRLVARRASSYHY